MVGRLLGMGGEMCEERLLGMGGEVVGDGRGDV